MEVFSGPPYPRLAPGVPCVEVPSLDLYRPGDEFRNPRPSEYRDLIDNYGSTDTEMVVAAPIVAEMNTPRFITPGDQAAIALTNARLYARQAALAFNGDD